MTTFAIALAAVLALSLEALASQANLPNMPVSKPVLKIKPNAPVYQPGKPVAQPGKPGDSPFVTNAGVASQPKVQLQPRVQPQPSAEQVKQLVQKIQQRVQQLQKLQQRVQQPGTPKAQ